MESNISDERSELQEDDEKLQTALHEYGSQWAYDDSSEDEEAEDEEQLLIDLEYEESEPTAHSTTASGSASHSQSYTAADEESGETVPRPSLELPSQVDVMENKTDPQTTLHLNRILQGILEEHINDIKEALRENKEKQTSLEENASEYSTKTEKKSMYAGVFRAPYFRYANSYPPSNEDVIQKKLSGDYDIVTQDAFKDLRHFNRTAKRMLRDAVYQDCLEKIMKPIVTKMESEIKKREKIIEEIDVMAYKLETETKQLNELQTSTLTSEVELMIEEVKKTIQELQTSIEEKTKIVQEYQKDLNRLEQEIEEKRKILPEDLLPTVDSNKVDWMKIAKQFFVGHSTWLDCQKAWENLVSPTVNRKAWTKEEGKTLAELVTKSANVDWREIAKTLGTGRTPFQCFSHYQRRLNADLKSRPWTDEEDARLVRVTNNVKDSVGFFSWSKVSTLMDSRSPVECMYRFTKIDPSQARGRWTELEDAKLLAAVEMIGPCWSKVAKFIGTRNMVQCRDRYLNCLAPNINYSHFTYDEDVKLLKLHKKLGPVWSKMVPEFIGRTDSMLLSRYRQLQRWKQQHEWFERQTDATKRMLLGKSLTVAERHRFQARAEDYMKVQLGVVAEDYKRKELDRQNHVDPDIIPPRPARHLRCYSFGGTNRSLNKWSVKLDVQRRLTENLHRLLEKETEANRENKGKGPSKMAEEVTEDIMQQSVVETLKGSKKRRSKFHLKGQIKKLEAALNKVFLTAGTVSVQELLQSSMFEKKKARNLEKNALVDSELKNILRKRGRTLSKLGRSRRFFERDVRPAKVIDEELDEWDHSVPLMLIKNFGVDIHYLCNAVKLQCLQFQDELSKLPSYDEDADFQMEEAETQEAIQKLLARTDISDTYKQQRLSILKGKLKSLRKIFREKKYLNSRIVENKISTFQDDLDYLETLVDDKMEKEVNKNLSLMACNPPGSIGTEFEAEMIEASLPSQSSNSLTETTISVIHISSSATSLPQSPPKSPAIETITSASASDGDKVSDVMENNKFTVPLVPPKRKRTRLFSRYLSNLASQDEPLRKQFKALSKEEIADEKKKLPDLNKKIFINLPFLPPSLSTLLGLRALFLMKYELINTAGYLYKPQRHGSTHQLDIDMADRMRRGEDIPAAESQSEIPVEDSGSWFLYTLPQQLTEQASRFEGYVSRHRGPGQRTLAEGNAEWLEKNGLNVFSLQNEALVFPLEERGGHLPASYGKGGHECDVDVKPVICEPRGASSHKRQKNSSYEVVMGFSGCHAEDCTSVKEVEEQNYRKTVTGCNKLPVVQNKISIIPASMIKTEPSATTVNSTISVNSYSVGDSSINTAVSSWDAGVQKYSMTQSDVGVYSLHSADHTESNVGGEDDDVVAVIHIDDEEGDNSQTSTVINICSGQPRNRRPELTVSKDEDIEFFSEHDKPSQFMVIPQETDHSIDLSGLELPESRVQSILSNKKLKNHKSRIVLVGVDEGSKRIVHFKSEKDKFTAYEAIPTTVAEDSLFRRKSLPKNFPVEKEKEKLLPDCIKAIRQTDDYKLLLARFRTLFLWPVLMSTIKPSPLSDGTLPTTLSKYSLPGVQSSEKRKRKKKSLRVKQSLAKKEHLQLIRENSLAARRRKMAERFSREGENVLDSGDRRMNTEEATGVSSEQQAMVAKPDVGEKMEVDVAQQSTHDATQAGENGQEETATETRAEVSAASAEEQDAGDENVEESKPRKKLGRPKGSKNKKYVPVVRDRSKRVVKRVLEDPPPAEPAKEVAKPLPQWWKDAVLAAMLAKKAMADDGEEDSEVSINDDDDFIDKGNYSDDEWYQKFREEEINKAKQNSTEEVNNSDSVTSTSQDIVEEETIEHE